MPDDKTNPESAPAGESQKINVNRNERDIGPRVDRLIRDGAQATMIAAPKQLLRLVASGFGAVAPHLLRAGTGIVSATKMIGDATNSAIKKFRDDETSNVSESKQSLGAITESAEKFQSEKRMANVRSIVGQASVQMPEQVPDTPVDHDWTARFFDNAKDVSNEEMQKLWAKLLAGEVESPGRASLRTLDILRNMTQKEAKLFARAVNYSFWDSRTAWMLRANTDHKALPDISVDELHSLIEAGLMMPYHNQQCVTGIFQSDGYCYFLYAGKKILRVQAEGFSISAYHFSMSGAQLTRYIEPTVNAEYLQQVANYIHREAGRAVEVADILTANFKNGQFEHDEFQKIAG